MQISTPILQTSSPQALRSTWLYLGTAVRTTRKQHDWNWDTKTTHNFL